MALSKIKANSVDTTSNVTVNTVGFSDGSTISSGWTGFKNRVINGAMVVDQRVNGGGISSSSWVVDRMLSIERGNYSTLTVTASQSTDAPAGFSKSLKVQIGTAEATSANKYMNGCDHRVEGYNFADFNFGTLNAKAFTLSFWVKSSITGLYPVSFFNAGVDRTYLATYTINSANTWEYKTITVPGDTSGTWNTTNGIGLGWQMSVASGSSNYGTPGSWGTTYRSGVSGQADLGATAGATWYITGMQLEKGSTASSFENRPIGTEIALCQRYFEVSNPFYFILSKYSAGASYGLVTTFKVEKRAIPTFSYTGTYVLAHGSGQGNYTNRTLSTDTLNLWSHTGYIGDGTYGSYFCGLESGKVFQYSAEI